MSEKSAGDRDDDSQSSSLLSASLLSRCPSCFIASLSSIILSRQSTVLSSVSRPPYPSLVSSSTTANTTAGPNETPRPSPTRLRQDSTDKLSLSSSELSLLTSQPFILSPLSSSSSSSSSSSCPPSPSPPPTSSSSLPSDRRTIKLPSSFSLPSQASFYSLPLQRLTDRHLVHHSSRLLSSRSSHYASDAFSPQECLQNNRRNYVKRRRRKRILNENSNICCITHHHQSCPDAIISNTPVTTSANQYDGRSGNSLRSCSLASSSSSSSSPSSSLVSRCSFASLRQLSVALRLSSKRQLLPVIISSVKNLVTTFYILSVFLLLSGSLPVIVAADLPFISTSKTGRLLHSGFGLNRAAVISSSSNIAMPDSLSSQPNTGDRPQQYGGTVLQFQQPRGDYAYNVDTSKTKANTSSSNSNVADTDAAAVADVDDHELDEISSTNATHPWKKPPPVVWVPYLGVVVIFAVFMVLIVTFWLHIRHSRYRAIQLVKSSPNSEWNEIQPGRWEASYGGHVYTVNQITQTRVLGAIAAAAVAAMGAGVKRAMSTGRLAPADEAGDCHIQDSSAFSEGIDAVDDERTRLLSSPPGRATHAPSRKSASGSVPASTSSASKQVPHVVPVSDSIWLLTEEQLMDSIRSSNGSHKSTPAPTPTTATTMTGDGLSTSTAGSITSSHRSHPSGQPPPVPPRAYGTFTVHDGPSAPPVLAHEAVLRLAIVENNAQARFSHPTRSKLSSQKSLPNPGEIALETVVPSSKMSQSSAIETSNPDMADESDDVCGALPMSAAGTSSIWMIGANDAAINENDEFISVIPETSPTQPLSLDEMTLPEPEPWMPSANTVYAPTPVARTSSQLGGRLPLMRSGGSNSSSASLSSQNQGGSGQGASMGGTNMIQGRRLSSVRGSVRGRGRGAAGRGQLSSLIAYSNMSKKKGGFIIPRG